MKLVRIMRHPAFRLAMLSAFVLLAVRGFVEREDFWQGIFTAVWVLLAFEEVERLTHWYVRRRHPS